MKAVYTLTVLVGVFALSALAQDKPLTKDEQQLVFLRERVAEAQGRVDADVARMKAKDQQIEKKINDVIKLITSVRDSTDSKTRIVSVKKDVIDGLNKTLAFYKQRRNARLQKLRDELASPEKFEDDKVLAFLDKKIDKRIDQIIYLTSTMTQAKEWKDNEKYAYTNYGYDGVSRRTSDKYVRYRKNLGQSNLQRKKTLGILKQYEDSIGRENHRLKQKLAATQKDEDRKAIEEQIAKNNKRLEEQRSKAEKMVLYSHVTGRPVDRQQAFETDKWVEDMSQNIVRDFREFVHLASIAKDDHFNLSLWQERLQKGEAFVARKKKASEAKQQAQDAESARKTEIRAAQDKAFAEAAREKAAAKKNLK